MGRDDVGGFHVPASPAATGGGPCPRHVAAEARRLRQKYLGGCAGGAGSGPGSDAPEAPGGARARSPAAGTPTGTKSPSLFRGGRRPSKACPVTPSGATTRNPTISPVASPGSSPQSSPLGTRPSRHGSPLVRSPASGHSPPTSPLGPASPGTSPGILRASAFPGAFEPASHSFRFPPQASSGTIGDNGGDSSGVIKQAGLADSAPVDAVTTAFGLGTLVATRPGTGCRTVDFGWARGYFRPDSVQSSRAAALEAHLRRLSTVFAASVDSLPRCASVQPPGTGASGATEAAAAASTASAAAVAAAAGAAVASAGPDSRGRSPLPGGESELAVRDVMAEATSLGNVRRLLAWLEEAVLEPGPLQRQDLVEMEAVLHGLVRTRTELARLRPGGRGRALEAERHAEESVRLHLSLLTSYTESELGRAQELDDAKGNSGLREACRYWGKVLEELTPSTVDSVTSGASGVASLPDDLPAGASAPERPLRPGAKLVDHADEAPSTSRLGTTYAEILKAAAPGASSCAAAASSLTDLAVAASAAAAAAAVAAAAQGGGNPSRSRGPAVRRSVSSQSPFSMARSASGPYVSASPVLATSSWSPPQVRSPPHLGPRRASSFGGPVRAGSPGGAASTLNPHGSVAVVSSSSYAAPAVAMRSTSGTRAAPTRRIGVGPSTAHSGSGSNTTTSSYSSVLTHVPMQTTRYLRQSLTSPSSPQRPLHVAAAAASPPNSAGNLLLMAANCQHTPASLSATTARVRTSPGRGGASAAPGPALPGSAATAAPIPPTPPATLTAVRPLHAPRVSVAPAPKASPPSPSGANVCLNIGHVGSSHGLSPLRGPLLPPGSLCMADLAATRAADGRGAGARGRPLAAAGSRDGASVSSSAFWSGSGNFVMPHSSPPFPTFVRAGAGGKPGSTPVEEEGGESDGSGRDGSLPPGPASVAASESPRHSPYWPLAPRGDDEDEDQTPATTEANSAAASPPVPGPVPAAVGGTRRHPQHNASVLHHFTSAPAAAMTVLPARPCRRC